MALHAATFKTRALSALVFVVVMLGGLLWNNWSYLFLFSIVHFGAWFEWHRLMEKIHPTYRQLDHFQRWLLMLAGWGFMLWMCDEAFTIGSFSVEEIGWWLMLTMLIVFPITEILFSKRFHFPHLKWAIGGLFYISLSFGMLIDLYEVEMEWENSLYVLGYATVPIMLLATIWINDTMAYISGSLIGKTPLSSVSPKKTWEGTIGGVVCSMGLMSLLAYFTHYPWFVVIPIAFIGSVIGTLGDLLESKLKRMAEVKDSGRILPGHGGFLDRFDSLLLAVPFVWLFFYIFKSSISY